MSTSISITDPSPAELLTSLRSSGATVAAAPDGRLSVQAPPGSLTDELRAAIKQHKAELLDLLAAESAGSTAAALSPTPPAMKVVLLLGDRWTLYRERLARRLATPGTSPAIDPTSASWRVLCDVRRHFGDWGVIPPEPTPPSDMATDPWWEGLE